MSLGYRFDKNDLIKILSLYIFNEVTIYFLIVSKELGINLLD